MSKMEKVNITTHCSWLHPHLEVRKTAHYGNGIFANAPIKQHERLAIFGGDIMYIDEITSLPESIQAYTLQIEERFVLGLRHLQGVESTDFFNHSCEPNAGFKGQIFLVAMRDIAENEEVTFDYAMTISQSVGSQYVFSMTCECQSSLCRHAITENDWQLPSLRERYQGYFSEYLQALIAQENRQS